MSQLNQLNVEDINTGTISYQLSPSSIASSPKSPVSRKKLKTSSPEGKGASKGLRLFSVMVCKKVEQKQLTNYNEVADELVYDFLGTAAYDEKNVRRRVYDALNVLMALGIIDKENKDIQWRGLPTSTQHDMDVLKVEIEERKRSINHKRRILEELTTQRIAMKQLIQRNTGKQNSNDSRIKLPFIAISTSNSTLIHCEMSENRDDLFFNFNAPFEIVDDIEVLKRLKMHQVAPHDLKNAIPNEVLASLSPTFSESILKT